MKNTALLLIAVALVVAACSEADTLPATSAGGSPTSSAAATTTTEPGGQSQTTTTSPPGTNPPTTTTSTVATPVPETDPGPVPAGLRLELREVAAGFDQPVFVTSPPRGEGLYVVDQPGRIFVVDGGTPAVVLDVRDRVRFGGEQGLLGLAFHPDFESNRLFYVNYVTEEGGRRTRVSEFALDDEGRANPAGERVLLSIPQPAGNHNGGMIAFGPDGFLYVGMGDGGGANDIYDHGQDPSTLLGAMLRIDVAVSDGGQYGLPADNPFVDGGDPGNLTGAAEVWAYGLRNPWRFAFDEAGGRLWIADVGQNEWEEITVVDLTSDEPVRNFGWPIVEGLDCFRSAVCTTDGLMAPLVVYSHGEGCSITGGYVYRGTAIPELTGHYFYGDYCSGFVRTIAVDAAGEIVAEADWSDDLGRIPELTSFGTDAAGNLYVMSGRGAVWEIVRS